MCNARGEMAQPAIACLEMLTGSGAVLVFDAELEILEVGFDQ